MRRTLAHRRLAWTLVFLTWFAQLCMPVAHAAMAAAPNSAMGAWCGTPANAAEARAALPAEILDALERDSLSADHLASCAQLCMVASTPAPLGATELPAFSPVAAPTQAPTRQPAVALRRHALLPPSHVPPAQA